MSPNQAAKQPYVMQFDIGTIKHLGLQMYSTLPSAIGELVANGWDANATRVDISIPEYPLGTDDSEIVIQDDGIGMSDADVRNKYVFAGRDRREMENTDETPAPWRRKVIGRKGIGKFSSFGIAKEIEIETVTGGETSRFVMNYDDILARAAKRTIEFPALPATGTVKKGTKITLRKFVKFNTRRVPIDNLRKGLARRFSVIGKDADFAVTINGTAISREDLDLQSLLDEDAEGNRYIWQYENRKIQDDEEWTVSGWIGALSKTTSNIDGIERGITLIARGKLVQEPFVFDAEVGQQFALSYLVGELHVEFVDDVEDTIGTNRNALVWDAEPNAALKQWGCGEVKKIAREWARRRSQDNERELEQNELYRNFKQRAAETGNERAVKLADQLVRQVVKKTPIAPPGELKSIIQMSLDFMEFNAFRDIAADLAAADLDNTSQILKLFKEWQVIEAKEMARVVEGRITTIEKLQSLIDKNALEVPTLHNFLKEFPWVIDPHWTLVADEVRYSQLLRTKFKEGDDIPEQDRRIDFLCVRESANLIVVEIKRPRLTASIKELDQIWDYVSFLRDRVSQTTDPGIRYESVTGYLLCGSVADTYQARERTKTLAKDNIYIRQYSDLLERARSLHSEFISRYNQLREAKNADSSEHLP